VSVYFLWFYTIYKFTILLFEYSPALVSCYHIFLHILFTYKIEFCFYSPVHFCYRTTYKREEQGR